MESAPTPHEPLNESDAAISAQRDYGIKWNPPETTATRDWWVRRLWPDGRFFFETGKEIDGKPGRMTEVGQLTGDDNELVHALIEAIDRQATVDNLVAEKSEWCRGLLYAGSAAYPRIIYYCPAERADTSIVGRAFLRLVAVLDREITRLRDAFVV